MKIYDLDSLKNFIENTGLYDLTQVTYKHIVGYYTYIYVVEPHQEMRIDLVCNEIYGSVDYIDFLLNYNSIDNPLNIKIGDEIKYVDFESIDKFRVQTNDDSIKSTLLSVNKSTRKDKNREKYINDSIALTPTLQDVPYNSVNIQGSQIIIGGK